MTDLNLQPPPLTTLLPSSTAASTDATDPVSLVSEASVYPRSLDQMRESQQRWLTRYHKPTMVSLPNVDYVQRMNSQPRVGKSLSFADVLEWARSRLPVPAAPTAICQFSYEQIEQLFMTVAEELCRQQQKTFIIDEHNAYALQNIMGYLAGDPTHTVLNLNKGLYLYGPTGVGKTLTLKVLRTVADAIAAPPVRIVPTVQLTEEVEQAKSSTALRTYFTGVLCLDDLGEEPRYIPLYGQAYYVIHSLLAERDRRFIDSGLLTHATSNLLPEELEGRYGSRIADRCRQLFNFVQLGTEETPSRR